MSVLISALLATAVSMGFHTQQPASSAQGALPPYLHAPSVGTYAKHAPDGVTILSSGRLLTPAGRHMPVPKWPHSLVLSPSGDKAFVACDGTGQVLMDWGSDKVVRLDLNPTGGKSNKKGNSGGAAFSPDGETLYWSGGDNGCVYVFDTASGSKKGEIPIDVPSGGRNWEDSYLHDLQISSDGSTLYGADVTNFRIVTIDTAQRTVTGSVKVGRYPYSIAVAGKTIWVANVGLFEYSPIGPPSDPKFDKRGLTRPPFGFPSKEARDGIEFEGRRIPGLGEPNTAESFSVWGVDVSDPARPAVISRIKTGLVIGAASDRGQTVGGSAPNFVVASGGSLWVSDGNNDMVERIDLRTRKIAARVRIRPSPLTAKLRGVWPSGLALSPDHKRLYVAETSINAVAVLDAQSLKVLGHIPTAWYPYRVAVSDDGRRLAVICFRGFGNGPKGGKQVPESPYLGMKGVFSVVDTPADKDLSQHTTTVLRNNGFINRSDARQEMSSPIIPTVPGQVSNQIKHVVFITKENHTYDAVFDRVPGAKHDPSLLRWGLNQRISAPGQPTLEGASVMTNHNALARQFTVSDNFYMEPEASGVGHRWLVGVQPNNLMQMNYTLGWDFKKETTAPGRRYSMGSNGSLLPEDYPEAGSMWEHLARRGIRFRNYGEGFEFPGVLEDEDEAPTGAREVGNYPMPKVLFDNTCFDFPIYNMNIPDQYRADQFIKDFTKLYLPPATSQPKRGSEKEAQMPGFINIAICNDHGAGPKPAKGYPYFASWMADNDLALGRIVEFLSKTKYWKNMAIFVTQDDSGGEPDHVDAQRSVLMVISPWAKRGYVSHRHTTIVSMHRTLYQIFGLPPLNMFDALANDFSDCFTEAPDYRPYTTVAVDKRIFDPQKAKDPKDPDYKKARQQTSILRDNPADEAWILRAGEGR